MENNNPSTIFAIPMWSYSFSAHSNYKTDFIDTLKSYREKQQLVENDLSSSDSVVTVHTLHHNPVFKPLVDTISHICKDIKKHYSLDKTVGLGIKAMSGSMTGPKQVQCSLKQSNNFLQGYYFLDTPADSGLIKIENPGKDPGHFSFPITENNLFNTQFYTSTIPEGTIFILPSNLSVDLTVNKSQYPRAIIHFFLCTT